MVMVRPYVRVLFRVSIRESEIFGLGVWLVSKITLQPHLLRPLVTAPHALSIGQFWCRPKQLQHGVRENADSDSEHTSTSPSASAFNVCGRCKVILRMGDERAERMGRGLRWTSRRKTRRTCGCQGD